MMNWKVRLRNKWWWFTIIPAVLLLVQQVAAIFGVTLDMTELQPQLIAVAGTIMSILVLLGVNIDMTTEGIGDSERAMAYETPHDYKLGKHAKEAADEQAVA